MTRPYSIRIFLPAGDPDGLRVVDKSNWTGVGLVFQRSGYRDAVARDETRRTGVYVLVGNTEDSGQPLIYIGEGDPVRPRLDAHYANKDFWNWGLLFVSKDSSLNKAHVRYLEYRLIQRARDAKQAKLGNVVNTTEPSLSEAEQADMESYLADMLSILPLVGLPVFDKPGAPGESAILFQLRSRGTQATGYETQSGFVVKAGSRAASTEVRSAHNYLRTMRRDLLEQEVLVEQGEHLVFTQDHPFNSPSTAAGVVLGRNANGRVEWKTQEGRTLKAIQIETAGEGALENDD